MRADFPIPLSPDSPARPLRIAAIGARGVPSNYSGVERIWEDLYSYLAAHGHRITCYCRPGVVEPGQGDYLGIRLVTTPCPGGRNAETLSHTWTSLRHALRHGDDADNGRPFDLIALHTLAPQWFSHLPGRVGIPVVSHVHGLDWQRQKWKRTPMRIGSRIIRHAERRMVHYASEIAVCSTNLVDYYRETYNRRVHYLPNGIIPGDAPFEPDTATLQRFGLTPGRFMVSIGRLVPEKRIEDTIAAFHLLRDRFADLKLAIVGAAASETYATRLRGLGGPRVVFTGQQRGEALRTLFRSAAAYVTASELEGLPMSLLECMEAHTPAVASDIPPHRQLLTGVEGYDLLFPVGQPRTLAERLERLLTSPQRARELAAAQQRFVRAEYAWPVLAERIERLYRQVAGEGQALPPAQTGDRRRAA